MDLIKLGLAVLEVVKKLLDWGRQQRDFSAGEQAQLAESQKEIMRMTEVGREMLRKVESLSDSELDDELRKLESGTSGNAQPGG